MLTIRIRGIYAAALTHLFHQAGPPWELVQPDEEMLACLARSWRMDSPALVIADEPDERGRRDTIHLSGPAEGVEQALHLMQQHCFDIITYQDNFQVGAIYLGVVGLCSQARRRAIVYMGNQQAGIL